MQFGLLLQGLGFKFIFFCSLGVAELLAYGSAFEVGGLEGEGGGEACFLKEDGLVGNEFGAGGGRDIYG